MSALYCPCEKNPNHKAWGIYARDSHTDDTSAFFLEKIVFGFDVAGAQADELCAQNPKKHYHVRGAAASAYLPDKLVLQ